MTTKTTAHLHLSRRDRIVMAWNIYERTVRDGLLGAAFVVALLLMHSLLSPAEAMPTIQPAIERQPIIMIATAHPTLPQPTATPWPTPEPQVIYVPVEQPAPAPEIVYVPVPVEAAPTLAPVEYSATSIQPAAPPEAPAGVSGPGGSGMMVAPDIGPIPVSSGDAASRWCAAAASAGKVSCVEEQP